MAASVLTSRGRHVCGVALTEDARGPIVAHWVSGSLDAGMQVIWFERIRGLLYGWLARAGVDWEAAVASGQLDVGPPDGFLSLSGADDIHTRIEAVTALVERALAAGYEGVSVGVDSRDALSVMPDAATQRAFEVAWEKFTREHRLWLLCLFGPAADAAHVQKAIRLHPREIAELEFCARLESDRITLAGEVDVSNSHLVRTYLRAASELVDLQDGAMTLDLTSTSFFDVQGVRELVELQRSGPERRVRLLNPPRSVRQVLALPGWRGALELVDTSAS